MNDAQFKEVQRQAANDAIRSAHDGVDVALAVSRAVIIKVIEEAQRSPNLQAFIMRLKAAQDEFEK